MQVGAWTETGEWRATRGLNEIYREIREHGVETNLAELEAFGFTTIPAALSADQVARIKAHLLKRAQDGDMGALKDEARVRLTVQDRLVFQDPIFEEVLLSPKMLALVTYLLGFNARLSRLSASLVGPDGEATQLHSDNPAEVPAPFSPYAHFAQCEFALTDYSEAGGALAIVPGSQRQFRRPRPDEAQLTGNARNPNAVPVEVPAGTAILWHGNVWHGAFPRTDPGLRLGLSALFCRQYFEPIEDLKDTVPDEVLARHGKESRLGKLLRLDTFHNATEEGPEKYGNSAGMSWFS